MLWNLGKPFHFSAKWMEPTSGARISRDDPCRALGGGPPHTLHEHRHSDSLLGVGWGMGSAALETLVSSDPLPHWTSDRVPPLTFHCPKLGGTQTNIAPSAPLEVLLYPLGTAFPTCPGSRKPSCPDLMNMPLINLSRVA